MKYLIIILSLIFSTLQIAKADEPSKLWDFHGLTLGASEQSVLAKYFDFECKSDGAIRRCISYFKCSEYPGFLCNGATDVSLVFAENKLVNISFPWFPGMFEETLTKLKTNYGEPLDDKKEEIKTKDGKSYENRTIIWHNGVSTIKYEKYSGNIGISRILYMLK